MKRIALPLPITVSCAVSAMKEASIDELANVESMNYKTAETLYNFFRMSKVEKQEALK